MGLNILYSVLSALCVIYLVGIIAEREFNFMNWFIWTYSGRWIPITGFIVHVIIFKIYFFPG